MLFIKMIRDLKKNIVQFLTIFIMAFICMFVVTGLGVCEYDSINRYLVDTNYRDLDVQGIPIYNENIEALRQLEEINAVDACYSTVGKLHLEKDIKMLFDFISGNDVSQMFLLEGVPYEPGESGIWLDASMCEVQNIKCGDTVSINVDGKQIIEEVKGLVASPTYIYYVVDSSYAEPLYGEYGFGYMDIKEYAGTQTVYNRLLVDVAGVNNQLYLTEEEDKYVENARKKIAAILDDENLAFINKKQDVSLKTYVESLDSNSAMLHVFPVFFGLIAMLGIMTTMTRLVARQRTTIGAMKALGFTSKIITMHYMSYSVIIVLIGAVTGAVSGYYILGNIMIEEYEYYYLNPYLEMPVAKVVYVAALLLIAAAVLVGYLGNYKILSLSASQILQPEAPKNTKQSWYEGLFIWKKLKFSVRWNVRDVTNNIFRTLMSIFGVVLCSALIFAAIGFLECIKHQVEWQYSGLIKAQSKISFVDDTPYSTVYEYAREYDGQMIQQSQLPLHSWY